jgi:hypothetical protein
LLSFTSTFEVCDNADSFSFDVYFSRLFGVNRVRIRVFVFPQELSRDRRTVFVRHWDRGCSNYRLVKYTG